MMPEPENPIDAKAIVMLTTCGKLLATSLKKPLMKYTQQLIIKK